MTKAPAKPKGGKTNATNISLPVPGQPLLHAGTSVMIARSGKCNLPLILWRKLGDDSWEECFLQADCTYGGCVPVDASLVPPDVKGGAGG